jgi:hypothetical protein
VQGREQRAPEATNGGTEVIRAFFIDGPDHGTTRTFEGDPPSEWLTVSVISMQAMPRDNDGDLLPTIGARHRYLRTYRTRKGVLIYEYDGTF